MLKYTSKRGEIYKINDKLALIYQKQLNVQPDILKLQISIKIVWKKFFLKIGKV